MEFPLTLTEWLLAMAVVVTGAVVQGTIGYGVALLGAPLLYLINPQLVPAPVILIGMILPLMILLRDWRAVYPVDVAWALPGSVAGAGLAAVVLGVLPQSRLELLFGCLVLLGVAMSAIGWAPRPRPLNLLGAGGLSSFMGTTTSIGGPPLALVFQNVGGARLRGTLSAIFVPAGVLSLTALAWIGRFGIEELLLGLLLLPGVITGFWLSGAAAVALDGRWLRPAVLATSAAAALTAIARSLL